ncbi:ribosome hibernation-promoting factor, HPF/YfiA family [Bacteroidetes bacterium endosymbiont of Geopemphigus sp.]|uniref:ribosome hibernation-promoting factor, HPF/YfiA family n=1 Tax=Bacteroidetes bacterium endosymbiont of Geopemphigus sp. TaxID=2047937 RepID=UPI000CD2142F|nr:ribosome-associated translation inhibitor RaiA [Bacteroidetes bacterium endosymbiont of Geopemphigus sp.]
MKIQIQTPGIEEHDNLESYIHKKLSKLSHYYDKIIAADVYLKLGNISLRENKIVEVRLSVPGDDLVVSKQGKCFKECIDLSIDTLKKLIIRKKEKDSAR